MRDILTDIHIHTYIHTYIQTNTHTVKNTEQEKKRKGQGKEREMRWKESNAKERMKVRNMQNDIKRYRTRERKGENIDTKRKQRVK